MMTSPNFNIEKRNCYRNITEVAVSISLCSIRITSKVSLRFYAIPLSCITAPCGVEKEYDPFQRVTSRRRDMLKLPRTIKVLCRHVFKCVLLITEIYSKICSIKHVWVLKHSSRYIYPGRNSYYVSRCNAFLDALWKGCSYRGRIASDRSDDSHFAVSHSSGNSRLWLTAPQNYWTRVTFTQAIKIQRIPCCLVIFLVLFPLFRIFM